MQQTIPVNDRVIATQVGITPITGPFTVDFPFFSLADVVVTWLPDGADAATTLIRGADYELVGVATEDGSFSSGTITLVLPVANGILSRFGNTTIERLSNFPLQGFFSRLALNAELNRITVVLQEHDGTIRIARTDLESSLHIPLSEADDGLVTVAAPKLQRAGRILAWDDLGNLIHSEQTLSDIESVNVGVFDELYVNVTGDSMSGPLSVPFLTTNNATINTSMQVMPGGTAKAPTPGANDVSTNLATTAWVVGFLGAQGQGEAVWEFAGSVAGDPGTGGLIIDPGVDIVREITMAKLDADGVARFLIAMRAGDAMVITNEFTPVTQYARYTLISDVTDNGTWVQFTAHLNDSSSPMEGPPLGTRMRVTGFLNTMAGGADISGVAAGYGLTGGGDTGVIPIAADPTVLAPLASPVFTGDPMAPTPGTGDNDESIATTRFVKNQGYVASGTLANYLPLVGGSLAGPGNLGVGGTLGVTGAMTGLTASFSGAVKAANVAIPAGGTIGAGLMFSTTPDFGLVFGSGIPNKAMPKGTVYLRSDGTGTPYYSSDGTAGGWLQIGSGGGGAAVHVGTSPPSTPTDGMMWFYTDASVGGGSLYIYYNDLFGSPQWVPTSPQPTSPVPGTLYLYSESVLASAAAEMRIAIPANAKKIEIVYQTANVGYVDAPVLFQAMEGSTPYTGVTYVDGLHYQAQNTPQAYASPAQPGFLYTTGRGFTGTLRPIINTVLNTVGGDGTFSGLNAATTAYTNGQCGFSYISGIPSVSTITGWRLVNATAVNFQAGSFMRCFVVT